MVKAAESDFLSSVAAQSVGRFDYEQNDGRFVKPRNSSATLIASLSICLLIASCTRPAIVPTSRESDGWVSLNRIMLLAKPPNDTASSLPPEVGSSSELLGSADSSRVDTTQRPMLLVNYLARWPDKARKMSIEGNVDVMQLVDSDGTVYRAQIDRSSHPLLDSAAVLAAHRSSYVPVRDIHGLPVGVRIRRTFRFNRDYWWVGDAPQWTRTYADGKVNPQDTIFRDSVFGDRHAAPDIEMFRTAHLVPELLSKPLKGVYLRSSSARVYGTRANQITGGPWGPCEVLADLWLRTNGSVATARFQWSSGYPSFDSLVSQALPSLRFSPARGRSGHPVNIWLRCCFEGWYREGSPDAGQSKRGWVR